MRKSEKTTFQWPKLRSFTLLYVPPTALMVFFHFCARLHIKACVHMPLTGRELHFQSYFLINLNCSHSGHTSQES